MQPIDTKVASVTLYHRGATVRRTATLDFTAGVPPELFIAGLPLALIDHTLRVRVEAEGGAVVLTNVRVGLHAPPRGAPPPSPEEKELTLVRAALEKSRDGAEQLAHEMQRLGEVAVLPRPVPEEGHAPTASPMPARALLEQLSEEALGRRLELLRAARDEVKRLEEALAMLERKRLLASTASHVRPDELRKSVHAVVAAGAVAKKGTLVLEYFVLGARWAPAYQCRMTRDCRQADLQLRAMVCQRTGEDWGGVTLNLSTASPMSWTELPELGAIRIGRSQPPPPGKRGFRPPPQGGASLFADYDRGLTKARAELPVIPQWRPPQLELAPMPEPQAFASAAMASGAGASFKDSDDDLSMAEVQEPELEAAMDAVPRRSEERAMKRMSAPPPPAMSPAPAPGAPMMRPMAAKASVSTRSAARAVGGLAAALRDDEGGGGVSASLEVVLYASLRLSAASDGSRGRLTPVDRRQAFHESLTALGLVATFDPLALVEAAESQGAAVYNVAAPGGTSDVRTEAGWYDYVYRTDATVDVPSDGTFHSVPVNTRTATGDVLYVCVPREDPQVYRQALVRNPLSAPLLPGPVEVYVAGEYVLTTTLPSVAPGGDFKLSLGVEQAIKVARNTKYQEQRSGDKVVATNELIHDLDIEVVNNLDREARCEVRERIPQPAAEAEVVVEEGKVTPAWEPYKQEERGTVIDGGRRWVLSVKGGGGTQRLTAQYRVKLYANNELVGGNRQEA